MAGPIQGTKEDKAELSAVPWTHNQNRNEAKGKVHTERNMLNRPAYSEWIYYRNRPKVNVNSKFSAVCSVEPLYKW